MISGQLIWNLPFIQFFAFVVGYKGKVRLELNIFFPLKRLR